MKRIGMTIFRTLLAAAVFLPAGAEGAGVRPAPDFTLSVIHVNDTHSRFEPSRTKLFVDLEGRLKGTTVYAELGGFPQVAEVINRLRAREPNPVLVHAGDLVQGSIYFSKYGGEADMRFWNQVKPDLATFGNHEFDRGADFLANMVLRKTTFPFVSSNVDFSGEPALAGIAPAPWIIKEFGKQRVGFTGATLTDTPFISGPGKKIVFNDPVLRVQKAADALTRKGINKIVLLSHLGYEADKALAAKTTGIDVIVGGHTHTLLGDWSSVGLPTAGPYPTAVKNKMGDTVLIVHAWAWGRIVGDLKVDFDPAGKIISWDGAPVAVVDSRWFRIYDVPDPAGAPKRLELVRNGGVEIKEYNGKELVAVGVGLKDFYLKYFAELEAALAGNPAIALTAGDPAANALAAEFAEGVREMRDLVATRAGEGLERGRNTGPGPLIADSMRAKTGAGIAISNLGTVRADLPPGPLTVAQLYEVLPFGDTLVLVKIKGADVMKIIEDGIDRSLQVYGENFSANPLIYVSGLKFDVDVKKTKGGRLSGVRVPEGAGYGAIDPAATYTVVVNSFIAEGGDLNDTLKNIPGKIDTGYIDVEVFLDFVKDKTLENQEPRIGLKIAAESVSH